jgi:hypothetical protein
MPRFSLLAEPPPTRSSSWTPLRIVHWILLAMALALWAWLMTAA